MARASSPAAETLPAVADRLGVSLDRVRRVLRKNPAVEALMPRLAGARIVTPAAARAIAAALGVTTPKKTAATAGGRRGSPAAGPGSPGGG